MTLAETLANWFVVHLQDSFAREAIVFIVSMMPILELRGGIIAGFALQMEWLPTFIIAFLGNILPIPFLLWGIRWVFKILKKTPLKKMVEWFEAKAEKKSGQIRKYGYLGVLLFVGIPLPGTGAWTGSLITVMLGLEPKKTFVVMIFGVILAGIIVSILSFGLLGSLGIGA